MNAPDAELFAAKVRNDEARRRSQAAWLGIPFDPTDLTDDAKREWLILFKQGKVGPHDLKKTLDEINTRQEKSNV